jgi:hypothetical protein
VAYEGSYPQDCFLVKFPVSLKNLVRFAHNWNDGILEKWRIGMMGLAEWGLFL